MGLGSLVKHCMGQNKLREWDVLHSADSHSYHLIKYGQFKELR